MDSRVVLVARDARDAFTAVGAVSAVDMVTCVSSHNVHLSGHNHWSCQK